MLSRKTIQLSLELVKKEYSSLWAFYHVLMSERVPNEDLILKIIDELERELMMTPYEDE